jgi:hypothetical protein
VASAYQALSRVAVQAARKADADHCKTNSVKHLKVTNSLDSFSRRSLGLQLAIVTALFAVFCATLFIRDFQWFLLGVRALNYAYELDLAEGIVWQQAEMIGNGTAYGDVSQPPFIVFHYPPLFHLASLLASKLSGSDLLISGRAISMASALGTTAVIALLVLSDRNYGAYVRWVCGLVTALLALSFEPVARWSLTCRVDMLAVFFSVLGLYLGLKCLKRERLVYVSAAFFVLAVFTKPTAISAAASIILFMLIRNRALARNGLIVAAVIFFCASILAVLAFGTGIAVHVLTYNINRLHLDNVWFIVQQCQLQLSCVVISIVFAAQYLKAELKSGAETGTRNAKRDACTKFDGNLRLLASIYLLVTSVSTLAVLKSGADSNYLIEWSFAICLTVGVSLLSSVSHISASWKLWASDSRQIAKPKEFELRMPVLMAMVYLLAFQSFVTRASPLVERFADSAKVKQLEALVSEIRDSDQPVASEDMVLTKRAGKQVIFEPMIIHELTAVGRWDETTLLQMVRDHKFKFFVTRGKSESDPTFAGPYSLSLAIAIDRAYPNASRFGGYWIRRP